MEDLLTEPLLPPSISMVHTTEMLEALSCSSCYTFCSILPHQGLAFLSVIQPSVFLIRVGLRSHQSL